MKRWEDTEERRAARKKIEDLVDEAQSTIAAAEKLADQHGVSFSWAGFAYGMGGWYVPRVNIREDEIALAEEVLKILNGGSGAITSYADNVVAVARMAFADGYSTVKSFIDSKTDDYSGEVGGWKASAGSC